MRQLRFAALALSLHCVNGEVNAMVGVVRVFDSPLIVDGRTYHVQVCARPADTIWEGWIEFRTADGTWHRTPRETTQPDLAAVNYWAGGLSATYLEGALHRALTGPTLLVPATEASPHFDGPAPRAVVPPEPPHDIAILDPFTVGAKGETHLRRELGALRGWHLRNIIRAYELADAGVDLEALPEDELVELIVAEVNQQIAES